VGPFSLQHDTSSGRGWRNGVPLWRVAAITLNKQPRTNDRARASSLGLGVVLKNFYLKNNIVSKILKEPRIWTDSLDKKWLTCQGRRFGTDNYLVKPLWSSGQSSWLQIQRSELDSCRYQIFWEVVLLERGQLSLVSTTEELIGRKSRGFGVESRFYGRRESTALAMRHPSIRKSWK
jgi:hypothetical protein